MGHTSDVDPYALYRRVFFRTLGITPPESESWWQSKHGPEWQRLNDEMFEVTFWWRDPQGSE
ncbi:hypothetical protein ACUOCP_04065, partial [Escherichia sp. R-CC3]